RRTSAGRRRFSATSGDGAPSRPSAGRSTSSSPPSSTTATTASTRRTSSSTTSAARARTSTSSGLTTSITRTAWTGTTRSPAPFPLPPPPGEGPALLSLLLAHPVPASDPAAWTRWTLDDQPAMTLELRPSPRPVRARLYVPTGIAARGRVRVGVETTPTPGRDSERAAGLHLGGQWLLVERLETP